MKRKPHLPVLQPIQIIRRLHLNSPASLVYPSSQTPCPPPEDTRAFPKAFTEPTSGTLPPQASVAQDVGQEVSGLAQRTPAKLGKIHVFSSTYCYI